MVLFAMAGCSTHVPLEVMEPAAYTAPASVQRLALIDRAPSEHTFQVLYSLRDALSESPRFEVVPNESAQAAFTASATPSGQMLSAATAKKICKDTASSGIASLESLTVNDEWEWSERSEERTESQRFLKKDGTQEEVAVVKAVTVYEATLSLDASSRWTLLDCNGAVLDEHTVALDQKWVGEAESRADARLNAGNVKRLQSTMMGDLGLLYRSRISPWSAQISRKLFRGGNAHIRAGRKAAVSGDWSSAYRRWKIAAKKGNSDSPRAWLNLAVYHEQKGNLKLALKYAKRASHKLNKGWLHRYVGALEESIEKKIRLGQQLGPDVEPTPESAPSK
jgi:tetratricopeptide (TPR) repeat protein